MDIIYRYDPYKAVDFQQFDTAELAIKALETGNRRHCEIVSRVQAEVMGEVAAPPVVIPSNPLSLGLSLVPGLAPIQNPFAIILGCSDARASVERIFDHSLNQLFTIRVAGNVLGTECLGSIEYAVRHIAADLRLMLVLGHTGCGAVAAAVDLYLTPDIYIDVVKTHSLRTIIDRILVVVRIADRSLQELCGPTTTKLPGYRAALWEMAVYLNAALTAHDLIRELQLTSHDKIQCVFGVYDLATHLVRGTPESTSAFEVAPATIEDFSRLCTFLAQSVRDRGILVPLADPNLA